MTVCLSFFIQQILAKIEIEIATATKIGKPWWKDLTNWSEGRIQKQARTGRLVLVRGNGDIKHADLDEKLRLLLPHIGIDDHTNVTKAFLIQNPNLEHGFEILRKQITEKHQDTSGLFKKEDWKMNPDRELRKKYLDVLNTQISKFRNEWNDGSQVCFFFFPFFFPFFLFFFSFPIT